MTRSLEYAREWMRDGDRLLERAKGRLTGTGPGLSALDLEIARYDFARAAELYLTGAIEHQHGRDGVQRARVGSEDSAHLVQHLEGRLRREAEAAWHAARQEPLGSQEKGSTGIEPTRTFAQSLRDRLAHAAPELFDRGAGPEPSRDPHPSRSR